MDPDVHTKGLGADRTNLPWTLRSSLRIIVVRESSVLEATAPDTRSRPAWATGLCCNDPAVVKGLYARHFPDVRSYVLQNSGTVADAQDVFQEAMAVLWLKAKENTLLPGTEPGAFLYQVARNRWLDQVRSAAHKHMRVVHDDRVLGQVDETDDGVEERLARLRSVYSTLDEKCRTVLDRFYFERKDLAAIGSELGVSEESIRTIKYRCMMKLRAFRKTIHGEDQHTA